MSPSAENVRKLRETLSTEAGAVELVEPAEPARVPYVDRLRSELRQGPQVLSKPRVTWLVRDWLPNDSVAVLYGPPGSGKSFYALSLALELARGGKWVGQKLEPQTVLYVAAERSSVLADRQEAWAKHHAADIPHTFWELSAAPPLRLGESLSALLQVIAEVQPTLVVLDTLAQLTLGTAENDGREWGEVSEALSQVREATKGGVVLAVHHTGKDTSKGMRGHTVLLGSVDVTLELAGDAEALKVRVDKLNAGAKPLPEWYRLEKLTLPPVGDDIAERDAAVLVETTGSTATASRAGEILELLQGDYADTGMSRPEVEQALDIHRNTAQRALRQLVTDGLVVPTGTGNRVRYYLASPDLGLTELLPE